MGYLAVRMLAEMARASSSTKFEYSQAWPLPFFEPSPESSNSDPGAILRLLDEVVADVLQIGKLVAGRS